MNEVEKVRPNVLLWLVAIGFFMETLDSTIVNTALPAMARSLGESPLQMQSVVIAYSLTIAVFIPASGWIADRFGTKKVFFSAILIFSIGSLLCAISQNLPQIVLSRVLQGAGGSMLLPIGRLAVLRAFPGKQFLPALSFVTVPGLIGPLLGPTLGGYLVEYASWHWIFLINIPIGIVGCIATLTSMPDSQRLARTRFDGGGFALLSLSMVTILIALDGLSGFGLPKATIFILIISGLASLTAYVLRAPKITDPLFSLDLFKVVSYRIGLLGNLFARIGSSGMPFLIPLLLQVSLGYSPLQSGMTMLPIAIAGLLAKRIAPALITRVGYRRMLIGNTVCVGLAISSFAFFSPDQPTWIRVIFLLIFGMVNSLQFTAMNTVTLKDLPIRHTASGNSLFSMIQMLGMSVAVAAAAAIISTFMDYYGVNENPTRALDAFHGAFVCLGLITCTSAWIFWQLSPDEPTDHPEQPEAMEVV